MFTRFKSFRILLVEDHADSARLLAREIAREAHLVSVARTGKDALALAARQPFDVVICDLGLPDIAGIDLLHTMRHRQPAPGIVVSGFRDEIEEIDPATAAGLSGCLTKPLDMDKVRTALAQLAA